jgi:hypothetical protein
MYVCHLITSHLRVYLVVNVSYKFDPRYEVQNKMRYTNGNNARPLLNRIL